MIHPMPVRLSGRGVPRLRFHWALLAVALFFFAGWVAADQLPSAGEQARRPSEPVAGLEPVPLPPLEQAEPGVRLALENARAELDARTAKGDTLPRELAQVYGETGKLYHAHVMLEPAGACYRNAAVLAPEDYRWPYYLGYLQGQTGALQEAVVSYRRTLELRPRFTVARLRLGQAYLELGQLERAGPPLYAAAADSGLRAAALFELGQLDYAKQNFETAVAWLLQALETDPTASRVHYTLALAYRGLGDLEQARSHMVLHGTLEPGFADPLVDELAKLSSGQRMLFQYGMSAAQRQEFGAAARAFREGLEIDPENIDARVSLARFLYLSGDRNRAEEEISRVLSRTPRQPLANFLYGLLRLESGDNERAVARFRAVLELEPDHSGAHFFLAEMLVREGDYAGASRHYAAALVQQPDNPDARLRNLLALIEAGIRQGELRQRLEAAHAAYPEAAELSYFLAALLSASPDEEVRDGKRALALAEGLFEQHPSPEHAELLAMAYAEVGDFGQAVRLQNEAVEMAFGANQLLLLPRLVANAELFQGGKPCRTPWIQEGLLANLGAADPAKAFRDYPTDDAF